MAERIEAWRKGKKHHENCVEDAKKALVQLHQELLHQELQADDSNSSQISLLTSDRSKALAGYQKLKKDREDLYPDKPPKTGTIAGLPFRNWSGEEAGVPVGSSDSTSDSTDARPQVLALGSQGQINALVFVCDVEIDVDTPDDLLQQFCVTYEVRVGTSALVISRSPPPTACLPAAPSLLYTHSGCVSWTQVHDEKVGIVSEAGAQVEMPLHREENMFDALLVHDGGDGSRIGALFGSQLLCETVSKETCINWVKRGNKARCVVMFTREEDWELVDQINQLMGYTPWLTCNATAISTEKNRVLSFIVLCLYADYARCPAAVGPKSFIDEVAMPQLKEVVRERVDAERRKGRLLIKTDPDQIQASWYPLKVVVRATYEPPREPPIPSGQDALVTMDAEEVKPPSFEQAQVAEALVRRTRGMLGEDAFKEFKDVQFLICVPAFTTLQAQTAYRVRKAGLLDRERNECEYSKVVMHVHGGASEGTFNAFKENAKSEPETLFVIIADVSARHSIAACLCIPALIPLAWTPFGSPPTPNVPRYVRASRRNVTTLRLAAARKTSTSTITRCSSWRTWLCFSTRRRHTIASPNAPASSIRTLARPVTRSSSGRLMMIP